MHPNPTYDPSTRQWSITINRAGQIVHLHPSHLVIASGVLGEPRIPNISSSNEFKGHTIHSSQYQGGAAYKDKHVIVLGAGNTSADICQDLHHRGAKRITMIQRSRTCVISSKVANIRLGNAYPDDVDIDVMDFRNAGTTIGMVREFMKVNQIWAEEVDKEMLEGLKRRGFEFTSGPDESGQLIMVYERGGGKISVSDFLRVWRVRIDDCVFPRIL